MVPGVAGDLMAFIVGAPDKGLPAVHRIDSALFTIVTAVGGVR